jgi:biopolymer transport protein ExbD
MPIKVPGSHAGKSISLKKIGGSLKGKGKKSPVWDLNVTPMTDMLVVLVVFLLQFFAATGEMLFITKDILLPQAYNSRALERSPVISISPESIGFEGSFIIKTAQVNERYYPEWKITPLINVLQQSKEAWLLSHPNKPFEGTVILQSDEGVEFKVIKMIIFTCAQSGYLNVNFAIRMRGGGEKTEASPPT